MLSGSDVFGIFFPLVVFCSNCGEIPGLYCSFVNSLLIAQGLHLSALLQELNPFEPFSSSGI
jgi:hypothetical protein